MLAGGGSAPVPEHNSGGYPVPKEKKHKFDSEAYAYVMRNMDALRNRVESLPEPVQAAIEAAIVIDNKAERDQLLAREMQGIEMQFQRVYIALMEKYLRLQQEKLILDQLEKQRQDDELAILLLLL